MPGISFTIQNPNSIPTANKSVIYYNRLDQSNLLFSFTQNIGIASVSPTDTFQIRFPDHLLQSLSENMLASEDWVVKKITLPGAANGHCFTILLSPRIESKFDQLSIAFQNLPGKNSTNGEVSLSIVIGGAKVPIVDNTKKLFVSAYPDQPKVLTDNILKPSILFNEEESGLESHQHLYVSNPNLQPPLANQLSLNLKYEQGRVGPLASENWDSQHKPFFKISFDYGNSADDLTDELQQGQDGYDPLTSAYNINAKLEEEDRWVLEKASGTTVWTIYPTAGNHDLFSAKQSNLDISFSHIISRLPEGHSTLYIQWGNIPGYNDGWKALDIRKKKPIPKVISFTAAGGNKSASINYGQGISLDWSVLGVSQLQLRCDENPNLNHLFKVPAGNVEPVLLYCGGVRPQENDAPGDCMALSTEEILPIDPINNFYLWAINQDGDKEGDAIGPVIIKLKEYPAPAFAGFISVKEAIAPLSPPEEKLFWVSPQNETITLEWNIKDLNVLHRIDILDPDGNTLAHLSDVAQKSVEVPFVKSGDYTVKLRGKISTDVIVRTITIKALFEEKLTLQRDINVKSNKNDYWDLLLNLDVARFEFQFCDFKGSVNIIVELAKNGKGQLILHPKEGCFSNRTFLPREERPRLDAYFSAPANPFKEMKAIDVIWEINPQSGELQITIPSVGHVRPDIDVWHLSLKSDKPEQLVFSSGGRSILHYLNSKDLRLESKKGKTKTDLIKVTTPPITNIELKGQSISPLRYHFYRMDFDWSSFNEFTQVEN